MTFELVTTILFALSSFIINYFFTMSLFINPNLIVRVKKSFLFGFAWFLLMAESGLAALFSNVLPASPFKIFLVILFVVFLSLFTPSARSRIIIPHKPKVTVSACRHLLLWLLLIITIFGTVWIVQTENTIRPQGFFTMIGSLHTGKYVFISDFIRRCNEIPIIQSSFGQSIFSAFVGNYSNLSSTILLYLLLSFSILSFYLVVRGFTQLLIGGANSISSVKTLPAEFIVIFGTFSLSMAWVLVNDSGNPVIFTGYSDTVFGLFISLILFLFVVEPMNFDPFRLFYVQVTLFSHAFLAAPQSLIIALPTVTIVLIRMYRENFKYLLQTLFAFSIGAGIWFGKTGMLLLSTDRASGNFPGIGQVVSSHFLDEITVDSLSPGIPYMVGNSYETLSEIYPQGIQSAKLSVLDRHDFARFIWHFEQLFLTSLRPIFWPLFGALALYIMITKQRRKFLRYNLGQELPNKLLHAFSFYVLSSLLLGLLPAFTLSINNHKWEMSRFSFPGLVLGMIALTAFLFMYLASINKLQILNLIILVLILPTFLHIGTLVFNISNRPSVVRVIDTDYGKIGFFTKPLEMRCEDFGGS